MEIGICLIQLDRGKLGVVLGVHALVAEDTTDLVDAVHAADDQALERKLGRNAHVHVDIERIVVCNKGSCRRAACDGVENRGFDLNVAHVVEIIAQMLDELRADDEVPLDLGVDDEVDIALTVAGFLIGQTVELLRQRQKGFGQQRDVLGAHGHFAALGPEDLALDADNIADVILLEAVVVVLIHLVLAGVELDSAFLVLQIAERDLTHAALGHHAPGDGNRFALHGVEVFPDFAAVGGLDKFRDLKRVVTLCLQIRELLPADLDLIADGKLLRAVLVLILLFLLHLNSLYSLVNSDSLSFYAQDFITQRADRRFDLDNLADRVTEQRSAERGVVGNAALHGVCFL